MKLYIDGPDDGDEGVYHLIAETGEHLASHYCSDRSWAPGDLEGRKPQRQQEWRARFGEYQVLWAGQDSMTSANLQRLNHEWATRMSVLDSADAR